MSQVIKVLQVLDLFSEQRVTLGAEEIAELLKVSRPTAFRYVRQLCDAGLLSGLSGRYALGARIIELDHHIRRCDPLLLASEAALKSIAGMAGCAAVLSSMHGDRVINVHHEAGPDLKLVSHGRGSLLPLFRGAASKVILAHLKPARLKRIYEAHRDDPDARAIAGDWPSFSRYFRDCRRAAFYVSRDEVDAGVSGIAAPIFNGDGLVIAGLALVFESQRSAFLNEQVIGEFVARYAAEISARLASSPESSSAPPVTPAPRSAKRRPAKKTTPA